MNANQLFNMLSRMLTNRLISWGIRKASHSVNSGPNGKQTPQQRQRDKATRNAVKRARQAARITRRMR